MDIEIQVLDLLFRRVSAEQVLARLERDTLTQPGQDAFLEQDRDAFLDAVDITLANYSKDEQQLLFDYHVGQRIRELSEELNLPPSRFLLPLDFARRALVRRDDGLACSIHRVLPWREAYLLLGQDLFVCAYLALLDEQDAVSRRNFSWPAVLRTDLPELNQLLDRGLAENHYHLNGSAQSFALTWCGLMNTPQTIREDSKYFGRFLQPSTIRRPRDSLLDNRARVQYAAACRCCLFQCLRDRQLRPGTDAGSFLDDFLPFDAVRGKIQILRELYGARLPQPDGRTECLDYALEPELLLPDAPYRALAGERSFLYGCFRACWRGRFSPREQQLFYLYLLLKHGFRSEMIQVNRQTGFENFSDYQDRKTKLFPSAAYGLEAQRTALNAPLLEGSVTSLEARICPEETSKELRALIEQIDRDYHFSQPGGQHQVPGLEEVPGPEEAGQLPYFFVVHFPKQADDRPGRPFTSVCRHQRYRKKVETWALALADALWRYPNLRRRVRGIDGCSHEIGCRPEVFAPAFRYLRGLRDTGWRPEDFTQASPPIRLAVTYHVGEDFLDIPSALRAMDEAIGFFHYRRGDRVGHALALGVDPADYYRGKGCVTLSKQERLDDLVWLLYRGRELGVALPPELESAMREEAGILLREIYGRAIREGQWSVSLQEYHCAMQLRGDDPLLYRTMHYRAPDEPCHPFSAARTDPRPKLRHYREDPVLAGLYYYYHFGEEEKRRGRMCCQVEPTPVAVDYISRCQDAMMALLAREGIVVECNPSSNVLIGTFGDYASHPIFRFHNDGFETDPQRRAACPQVQVCVNTDDLGVFDTSLEFEYALLYHALRQQAPHRLSADTMRYLENLRQMGQRAVFPAAWV